MKLSVVMPVYNEEATLEEIVAKVLATPFEKELILVDDGSQDRSREIMAGLEAAHPEVRCIYHEQNKGKGGALSTGFQSVDGRPGGDPGRGPRVRPGGLRQAASSPDRAGRGRRGVRQPLPWPRFGEACTSVCTPSAIAS